MRSLLTLLVCALALAAIPAPGEAQLAASVLPGSRAVPVGAPAAVFATVVNAGPADGTDCSIALASMVAGVTLSYQTTDPLTNRATGSPDTPVTIPSGGSQSFVLTLTASAPVPSTELGFVFGCADLEPAATIHGLNTLRFTAAAGPILDIVPLAVTDSGDGVARIVGTGAFAVATTNLGAAGLAAAVPYVGGTPLPLDLSVCQTDPATGDCLAPPASSLIAHYGAGAVATYGVFVTATGDVPLDPARRRMGLAFSSPGRHDRHVRPYGATSVAVDALCTTACAAREAEPFGSLTFVTGPASLGPTFTPQYGLGPIPGEGYMAVAWYGPNRVDPSMVLTYDWADDAPRGLGLNREGVGPVEPLTHFLDCGGGITGPCDTILVGQPVGAVTFVDTLVPSVSGGAPLVLRGTLRLR